MEQGGGREYGCQSICTCALSCGYPLDFVQRYRTDCDGSGGRASDVTSVRTPPSPVDLKPETRMPGPQRHMAHARACTCRMAHARACTCRMLDTAIHLASGSQRPDPLYTPPSPNSPEQCCDCDFPQHPPQTALSRAGHTRQGSTVKWSTRHALRIREALRHARVGGGRAHAHTWCHGGPCN